MTDSNRDLKFRLKDGREILIGTNVNTNGRDVQRIRILNDIVWEKTKPTTLRLTASPTSINSGQTFKLVATVVDSNGNGINGNIIFTGNGISGSKKVVATNGIATLNNITSTNIGNNTYTATFPKTDIYLESQDTATVKVQKETPVLTVYGDKTVYDTWKIGVKLTKSDGKTVLTGRTISLTINSKTYTAKTNSKGIASFTIDINKTGTGKKKATYKYVTNSTTNSGDQTKYNNKSVDQNYTIEKYKNKTLTIDSNKVSLGSKSVDRRTQEWEKVSGGYQCRKTGQACNVSRAYTVGSNSGTFHTVDTIKIPFKQDGVAKIKQATFKFNSISLAQACKGSYLGGYFPSPPVVKLCVSSTTFKQGSGAKAFGTSQSYGYHYSNHTNLSQTITWGERTVAKNPVVSIYYGTNQGVEEACIKITGISLSVSYVPKQKTTF